MFDITRKMAFAFLTAFLIGAGADPAEAQSFTPSRFSVEVRGVGPDVILIPGLGSSREVWAAQAEQLAASHRLHLVQVSGFAGQPVGAPAGQVIAPLVEELARYIEANGLERPAVIGHSMGGLTGLMLARTHPQRVGRLMIVDALPFFSAMFGPQVTAASAEPQARAMRDRVSAADDAAFAAQQNMGIARLVKTEARRAEVVQWSLASDRATFAQAMYEVMTTDMRPEVAQVTAPITVVYAYDAAMGPEAMSPDAALSTHLSAEDQQRLAALSQSLGIPTETLERMRPWMAALTLSVVPIIRAGYDPQLGVDRAVAAWSTQHEKTLRSFETPEQQVNFFAGLDEEVQVAMLREAIDEAEAGVEVVNAISAAWDRGDILTIEEQVIAEVRTSYPRVHQAFFVDRNNAWMDVLVQELDGAGVDFVAVGSGHLYGPDGLIAQLRARGVRVERVQ